MYPSTMPFISSHRRPISRRSAFLALLLIAPAPSIGVWFAAYSNYPQMGSLIWSISKVWLILGPVLWYLFIQRQPIVLPKMDSQGLTIGLISGIGLFGIIFSSYWFIGRMSIDFSLLKSMLIERGIDTSGKYLLLALYLTVVNSLMEEYVYRWFFRNQLALICSSSMAVILSAVLFTVHHTLVLSAYIPWIFNLLVSFGIFSGGFIWSTLYKKYDRLWPSYISHIGADIGVFAAGYCALYTFA